MAIHKICVCVFRQSYYYGIYGHKFSTLLLISAYYSPENWSRDEVNSWLTDRVHEYGLDLDLPQRFPMNGMLIISTTADYP